MKAALMYGANDIRYEEVPLPEYGEGGLLLKVEAVGLCGSDVRNLTTDSRSGNYPHVYGHEVVGTVAEVGSKVIKYKIGDRLYVYPCVPCLSCEQCRMGNSNMCTNMKMYDKTQGGFAEYMAIPEWGVDGPNIYPIPDSVPFEIAVMAEPLSSVYACQDNISVTLNDTVVIIGAGPIGCLHAELAKKRGAKKVIMVEINDKRLEESLQYGVDETINSLKEDPIRKVFELTQNQGAEKVISANPSVKAQGQAIFMAKKTGTVVYFGGVAKGALTEIDTNQAHYNNLWIYGHYGSDTIQVKKAFDMIMDGSINGKKYISHILPLEKITEAISLTKSGEAMKVICKP